MYKSRENHRHMKTDEMGDSIRDASVRVEA